MEQRDHWLNVARKHILDHVVIEFNTRSIDWPSTERENSRPAGTERVGWNAQRLHAGIVDLVVVV